MPRQHAEVVFRVVILYPGPTGVTPPAPRAPVHFDDELVVRPVEVSTKLPPGAFPRNAGLLHREGNCWITP